MEGKGGPDETARTQREMTGTSKNYKLLFSFNVMIINRDLYDKLILCASFISIALHKDEYADHYTRELGFQLGYLLVIDCKTIADEEGDQHDSKGYPLDR
jgi:hypothetical protein